MAEFNFSLTDGNQDELMKMNKTLNWLMQNLDHVNVKQLYTEYCNIQSENGETVIDGPLIKMTAGSTTLRLKMGKELSDFVFKLYNVTGAETISLNSTGNITSNNMTANNITVLDNLLVKQASVASASITIGDGLGGVTPATITYSGQDVPLSDVQLTLVSVSNVTLRGAAGGYIQLDAGLVNVTNDLTVAGLMQASSGSITGNLIVSGTITGTLSGNITGSAASLSGSGVIDIGGTGCRLDVTGGSLRLKNANGAYLLIEDANLTYYDSTGGAHIIV